MIAVYKISNKIDGKVYIGQSWNVEKRWENEKCGYINEIFNRAFKKHGKENFEFSIIEEFNFENNSENQEILNDLEIKYIKEYNSTNRNFGYNIKEGGHRGRHSEESKRKISEANKGKKHWLGKKHSEETKNKIRQKNIGRKMSEEAKEKIRRRVISQETREKMSISSKGRKWTDKQREEICEALHKRVISQETREKISFIHKGKEVSQETREKISAAKKGHVTKEETKQLLRDISKQKKEVRCIETGVIYESINEAARQTQINNSSIGSVASGKRKTAGGLSWEFIN